MSREDLEQLRLNLSRSSPLAEAVDRCLHQVDEHTLPAVLQTLASLARTGLHSPAASSAAVASRCCAQASDCPR